MKKNLIEIPIIVLGVVIWICYDKIKAILPHSSHIIVAKIENIIAIFLPILILVFAINAYKDFKHKTISKRFFILLEVIYMGYFLILGIKCVVVIVAWLYKI